MRPTDEDQPGSRRPNLMSSARRSSHEVNILDMLDRQASGPLPRRIRRFLRRPAPFWYGAAGLFVCALVGTLAWLTYDGAPAVVDTALDGSIKPVAEAPAAADMVGNAPLIASVAGSATAPDAAAPAGATIVDLDLAPEPEVAMAGLPASAHALPQQQATGRITAHAFPRHPPRPAAHTVPAKAAPRANRASKLAHAEQAAPRPRRQPAPSKAAPAVDTDVALITAVIQHANARQEAQEAACGDKACTTYKP